MHRQGKMVFIYVYGHRSQLNAKRARRHKSSQSRTQSDLRCIYRYLYIKPTTRGVSIAFEFLFYWQTVAVGMLISIFGRES